MDDMTFFREGTLRICGSLDVDEALHNCLVFLKRFMPLNCIDFSLFESDVGAIRIVALAADFKMKYSLGTPILLSELSQAYIKSHTGKVMIVDSTADSPPAKEVSDALGLRNLSGIGMPLRIKGEQLGVIGVLSNSAEHFTTEHARLLKLLHDPFAIAMSNYLRYREVLRLKELLADDNQYLQRELHRLSGDEIVGERFGLREVMDQVYQVAPVESPVLILGETGAGKEVIANAIHYSSQRRNGPLIKVNCGAIPEGLMDSELFGHEKGAFTGATMMKRGRFERADGGTIFLDEVGELPAAAQVRLLRVLQERQIERVGGTEQVAVNVRVVAATHRDLQSMIRRSEFREDLWYRINVFPIRVPPLRERKADIPAFVYHFIERKSREMNLRTQPVLAQGTLERLQQYDWPGNVRELENVIERELIRSQSKSVSEPLRFEEISGPQYQRSTTWLKKQVPSPDALMNLDNLLRVHITRVLQLTKGKIQGRNGAAALLGVHPNTLRHRLRKLGIEFGRSRGWN